MPTIERMFAEWRSLYAEWVISELALREARQLGRGRLAVAELEARVRRLQHECSVALDETSAALASSRTDVRYEQTADA